MTVLQIVVLAVVQGITEFLPISSSAHLILPSALLGFPDQGLAFDVAVHVGTLLAVILYLRKDIADISVAWLGQWGRRGSSTGSRLGWMIILATLPAGVAGLVLNDMVETHLRSVAVIAATTILFGVLLGVADKASAQTRSLTGLGWKSAVLIGCAQVLALVPGTSRSGVTMTAALALGFDRVSAARFSFLLSIPIILLSGGYKAWGLLESESVPWGDIFLGVFLSALTAYLCIRLFMKWIDRVGMMPFVWYRLLLGAVLVGLMAGGFV